MSIRVVGGEGAVAQEARRLLTARDAAATPDERMLLDTDNPARARAALKEARARRIARVVLISSLAADRAPGIPVNRPAAEVRKLVETCGLPFTLLLPNHLYQDDLTFREGIAERGVYPLPIGAEGMSRVDARDVAEAAIRALHDPGHDGKIYPVVGPEALSVDEVVEYYRRYLGRNIRPSDDGGPLADRYRPFRESGLRARCEDFVRMGQLLGRPARPFGMFVCETAKRWTAPRVP